MQTYDILSTENDKVLYSGQFGSFKTCLEQAVADQIDLSYANLKGKNLLNAELDDARLNHADLRYTNLSGANLSESLLECAKLSNTALFNTCLAHSEMKRCDFKGASFGATEISGATLSGSSFAGLSCFSLNFIGAKAMQGCLYINPDGQECGLNKAPIVIHGAAQLPIIFMDRHIKIGHKVLEYSHWIKILKRTLPQIQDRKS